MHTAHCNAPSTRLGVSPPCLHPGIPPSVERHDTGVYAQVCESAPTEETLFKVRTENQQMFLYIVSISFQPHPKLKNKRTVCEQIQEK